MPVETLRRELSRALQEMGVEAPGEIALERPRNPEHGDWATNVAMTLAKPLARAPRLIAEELVARLDLSAAGLTAAEVAGPGFINFRLASDYLAEGSGAPSPRANPSGAARRVGASRSSSSSSPANPTGPLHIGHGRQAVLGDTVAEAAGRGARYGEFHYNDAGEPDRAGPAPPRARATSSTSPGRSPSPRTATTASTSPRSLARSPSATAERWVGDESPEAMDTSAHLRGARAARRAEPRPARVPRAASTSFLLQSSALLRRPRVKTPSGG